MPPSERPHVRQELVETLYHVLWELVHVFFEHRGLLAGRDGRQRHDAGASSFLYPFLARAGDTNSSRSLEDVRRSVLMKAREIGELRAADADRERGRAAQRPRRRCGRASTRGGKLLALGNGGSATDAMDVVADFRTPHGSRAGRPAIDLTEDPAILTAIANDIGAERDLLAPGDRLRVGRRRAARALDIGQLAQRDRRARRGAPPRALRRSRWSATTAGAIGADGLADHVIVTRSEHIPRIQEAQASAYHALRRARRA